MRDNERQCGHNRHGQQQHSGTLLYFNEGTKGPKVCRQHTPLTITPPAQLELLIQGRVKLFFIFNLYACPFSSWPCSLFCDNIQFLFFGCGFNSITCLATEGHGFLGVILDFLAILHILLLLSLSFVQEYILLSFGFYNYSSVLNFVRGIILF